MRQKTMRGSFAAYLRCFMSQIMKLRTKNSKRRTQGTRMNSVGILRKRSPTVNFSDTACSCRKRVPPIAVVIETSLGLFRLKAVVTASSVRSSKSFVDRN